MSLLLPHEPADEANDGEEGFDWDYSPPSPPSSPRPKHVDNFIIEYGDMLWVLKSNSKYDMEDFSFKSPKGLMWGCDYYVDKTIKMLGGVDDKNYHFSEFSVNYDDGIFATYNSGQDIFGALDKRVLYNDFVKNMVDHSDKSPKELDEIHKQLLKKRIVKKLLDTPSKADIKKREDIHRDYLKGKIESCILKISPTLYGVAKHAKQSVNIKFEFISEKEMCQYGKLARFEKYACDDGVIRADFKDYLFYLLKGLYKKHDDEHDPFIWISLRLQEQIQSIFPHLAVQSQPAAPGCFLPTIVISANIDVGDALH